MNPIRAIFSDNEGCIIPGKGIPLPLCDLLELRTALSRIRPVGFGICTGRPVSYVEAMVQILDLIDSPIPCVCEGGCVIYWPQTDQWEPVCVLSASDQKAILDQLDGVHYRIEPGKVGCLSLYPNAPNTVDDIYQVLAQTSLFSQYTFKKSVAAVDITPTGVDKSLGLKYACDKLGIPLSNVLSIGDAHNDIPMLKQTGYSACPSNATEDVKAIVDFVAPSESTQGMIEILAHFEGLYQK